MPCFILLIFACWFLQLQDDDDDAALLYPKCLGIYGNWLAETPLIIQRSSWRNI